VTVVHALQPQDGHEGRSTERTTIWKKSWKKTYGEKFWKFFRQISTYLNGREVVWCTYRNSFFNTSFKRGKLILLFLWSDAWLVSGKSCSAWRWVMQFLLGAGKWQVHSTLSVNTLYNTVVRCGVSNKCGTWTVLKRKNITRVLKVALPRVYSSSETLLYFI
jgi:hypothetical protein